MRCFLWILTAAVLTAGCQGPFMTGGFPQGVPYRGYGVDGPGPGVVQPDSYQPMSLQGASFSTAPSPMMGETAVMRSGMPPVMTPMPAGVSMPSGPMLAMGPAGPETAGMNVPMPPMPVMVAPSSQINFLGYEGLTIYWSETVRGAFDSEPCVCPGTHDFPQGGIYRLKLTNVPGHPGIELYPTLEVAPTMARTQAFLAHCPVPIEFTPSDFDQALSGNFVTKVVYLPNPEYQSLAVAGVGTLVNTQLEPGVDPVVEAGNRGAILAIIRLGNKDLGASAKQANTQQNGAGKMMLTPMGTQPMVNGPMMGQMANTYAMSGSSIPQNAISGVNIPAYGTPLTKTSTGIPGPPQLPQGQHATNRYPVLRAEPIPVPPVPGATLVQPQQIYGGMHPAPMDIFVAPQPQR